MPRHRLSDTQWVSISDMFPAPKRMGRPPRDSREILDAIFWIMRTGAPWRDLPEEYGPFGTAWDLFDKWTSDGTLDRVLNRLGHSNLWRGARPNPWRRYERSVLS